MQTKLKTLAVLCGAFMTITIASAERLPNPLGENYIGVGLGYGWIEVSGMSNPDGWIAGTGINYNIQSDSKLGMDIGVAYNYARLTSGGFSATEVASVFETAGPTGGGVRATGHRLSGHYTLFTDMNALKPFISADLGYNWIKTEVFGFSATDNSWDWGFTGGVEFGSGSWRFTPYLSWKRDQDLKESMWSGGLNLHYWLTDSMGLGAGYNMSEGPERAHTMLLTVGWRY
jgi:hypothetical protein